MRRWAPLSLLVIFGVPSCRGDCLWYTNPFSCPASSPLRAQAAVRHVRSDGKQRRLRVLTPPFGEQPVSFSRSCPSCLQALRRTSCKHICIYPSGGSECILSYIHCAAGIPQLSISTLRARCRRHSANSEFTGTSSCCIRASLQQLPGARLHCVCPNCPI